MMDPVFVDTSEGRALVADSLKPKKDVNKIPDSSEDNSESKKKKLEKYEEQATTHASEKDKLETKRGDFFLSLIT